MEVDDLALLAIHEKKLKEAVAAVTAALAERDAVNERLDKANQAQIAYKTLIEQTRERLGVSSKIPQEERRSEPGPEPEEEINRVDWTHSVLMESGDKGLIPPDVFRLAQKAGVVMNHNYPYTVLSKLVERGLAIKRGTRYYGKEVKK